MKKHRLLISIASAFIIPAAIILIAMKGAKTSIAPARPEGPCDIYAAGGSPCVVAHSTTRALYAAYNGPLYQLLRQSDGKMMDIGVVRPTEGDAGGYADAAAQDAFCANATCWITKLYDQSGNGNDLTQAPRGGFSGPAMGGFNNVPIADMAPISIMGHKAYGIFIAPGMGLRQNDAKGTAVDDQAEGQYWVINGRHYNNGCCFDYGNAETDSRDDGDGTMETTYYGNSTGWYHGPGAGPWIMTDQENNLVGCVNPSPNDKGCKIPIINWRFVTAMADGEPHHWRSMGGDAQHGNLDVMFDGTRITNDRNSYDPMRKQGAILLGNGGDNSNGSQGTFYEGAMTAAGTFPTKETNIKIQANVVAANYAEPMLSLTPDVPLNPPGLQTFALASSQYAVLHFTNTTGATLNNVTLGLIIPKGWKSVALGAQSSSKKLIREIKPGASVVTTFKVMSGLAAWNGNLTGMASWKDPLSNMPVTWSINEKVRSVSPVKINEFRISDGSADNSSNSFIELYNAGKNAVDISNWIVNQHATQMPSFSAIKIPATTTLAAHGFYLLGLANSGLAVPAKKGESTIYVRTAAGMSAGDMVKIGSGPMAETRKIISLTTPEAEAAGAQPGGRGAGAAGSTVIWQPLPEGPIITVPVGAVNIPVVSTNGFRVGQKMAIGYGATYPAVGLGTEKYEVVTVTRIGKGGTQAYLATDAKAGATTLRVSSVNNISVGDKIRLDIGSKGHGIETVTVTKVGTQSSRSPGRGPFTASEDTGTGLELSAPLKFNHAANMPFSVNGSGISFEPATAFAHSSNEPVLALGSALTLDRPLINNQDINAVVYDASAKNAGYQGDKQPNQWFGGPALATSAGSISLRDAAGNVVDGLNYGGVVDPWLAGGFMATSGAGENGNFVLSPGMGGGFRNGAVASANRSAGRFPDGFDSDNNRNDFMLQNTVMLATAVTAGANNIKVSSAANFSAGQKFIIGSGVNSEVAVIATVGTAGGTTLGSAAAAGAVTFSVGSAAGFEKGETIIVGSGSERETAIVASVVIPRRGGGGRNATPAESVTLTAQLKYGHNAGAEVAGTGLTLVKPLSKAHADGTQIASSIPTPGAPNEYVKKR